ncbi:MAG: hypothetical protein AAGD28_15035 [Bacteroidota bacterium]
MPLKRNPDSSMLVRIKDLFLKHYLLILTLAALLMALADRTFRERNRIWSDGEGYYLYLPGVFIYGFDADELPVLSPERYKPHEESNKRYTRYSSGVAIMIAPFFLLTHALTSIGLFEGPADGYSVVYSNGIAIAAIFYCMLGFWFLRKVLDEHFSKWTTALTIFGLYFGTNMVYYSFMEPAMSHIYSFCLFALLLYVTPKVYQNPTFRNLFLLGILIGFITQIRLTNFCIALFVLFFSIQKKEDFVDRWDFILKNYKALLLLIPGFVIPWIPQMMYWYHVTGSPLIFSYGYTPESFFPYRTHPKIWRVLIDVQNGLFVYAPILFLSLLGMIQTSYKNILNGPLITLIFILFTYIFGAYSAWWFGGAYGHRAYIEFFPFMAIPMAYVIDQMKNIQIVFRSAIYVVLLWWVVYSVRLTYLYRGPWDGANWNWTTFEQVLDKAWIF